MAMLNRIIDNRREKYQELKGLSEAEIYNDFIGCGGLYLAAEMVRKMDLKKGDIVLDLGCGKGETSIYLAKNFGVTVVGVDYWNPAEQLQERAISNGLSDKIVPLQIDITQNIPFNENHFDAIFCMNSLFMFGENKEFLDRLIATLKVGGTLCVGSECFNKEPNFTSIEDVPMVYNFDWHWKVWEECYSKYHSPNWWKSHLGSIDCLEVKYCEELEDGRALFEDFAQNYDNYISKSIRDINAVVPKSMIVDQIEYGVKSGLYPTLYILTGIKI